MWCSKLYGFVIPPAPAIFIDRSGESAAVAKAVKGFVSTHTMTLPPEVMENPKEHVDALHRMSVVPHERRHFHDFLATTIGNHAFYASVALTLDMFTTLYRAMFAEKRKAITLPLPYRRIDVTTCPDIDDIERKVIKLCEASALLTQHQFVAMGMEVDSINALTRSFLNTPPYGEILRSMNDLVELVGPDPDVLHDIGLLVLAAMCEEPSYPLSNRDELFLQRMASWATSDPANARRELRATASSLWDRRGRSGLLGVEKSLRPWRNRIEKVLNLHTPEMRNLVSSMLTEFDHHARLMHERLIEDPMAYANHHRYLTADWVWPIAYSVTANTGFNLGKPLNGQPYMNQDLCNQFATMFAPARNLAYRKIQPHELTWLCCWLLTHEDQYGVRFTFSGINENAYFGSVRAELGRK